jgi:hypothetical protein
MAGNSKWFESGEEKINIFLLYIFSDSLKPGLQEQPKTFRFLHL